MRGYSIKRLAIGSWVFLLFVCALTSSARAGDPKKYFRTIKTEHFNVHYHQGLEHEARIAATICEETHEDLTILFGWEVQGPTEVVITDRTDSANGSASSMGRPVMRLHATAPSLGMTLQAYDHYFRKLIIHEYTHIVHLSIRGPVQELVNKIFGDVFLPNQMAPRWLVEGLAVLIESHRTTVGRIRSSLYPMYIRTDALSGRLQTLGQLSNATFDYLRGSKQYIYGAMFLQYVYEKYGMDKLISLGHKYGNLIIPYGLNRMFKETFGQDLISLYDEWIAHVKKDAEQVREALIEEGLTTSTCLTDDGEEKGRPIFSQDDKSLLVAIGNGMKEAAIFEFPLDGAKMKPLVRARGNSYLTSDRSGRLFYSRRAAVGRFYRFNDMFVYDPRQDDPRRITYGMRAYYGAVNPRGDRLVVASKNGGTTKLVLIDENGNKIKNLVDSKPDDQVYEPYWSPDGKRVAVIIRRGPQVDLGIVDVDTGKTKFITNDRFLEQSPYYSPDGRYLVFVSNRSQIDNIYAYDFKTGKTLQITNVLTGAFAPALSHDGKTLAFLRYSTFGYDLHVMPFTPLSAPDAKPPTYKWLTPKPPPIPSTAKSERYNPLPTLLPSHWMLNTMMDTDWNITLQATTTFADVANRHKIGLELNYLTHEDTLGGQVGYSYAALGPTFRLGMSRRLVPRNDGFIANGEPHKWHQIVTRGSIQLGFTFPEVDDGHVLTLGYSVVHGKPREKPTYELDPREQVPTIPVEYFRAGFSLGWSYSDTVTSPFGLSPHKGRTISTSFEIYHPSLGGTQTLATFRYSWTEYLQIPWFNYHSFSLTLRGGVRVSDPPNDGGFSVGGYSEQNVVDTIINGTSPGTPSLRGYPPSSFAGSRYHAIKPQYRFPIWYAELGYATVPLFLRRIQGAFFSDNVIISYDDINREDWRSSLGVELLWTFILGYYSTLTLRLGYARGLMKGGDNEYIMVVSGGL